MLVAVTINGVPVTSLLGSIDVDEQINTRNRLSLRIISPDGLYRPVVGDEIIVTVDGTRIHGGHLDHVEESTYGAESRSPTALHYSLGATDFNGLADRRLVTASLPSQTVKLTLQTLDDYLTPYGVTLDAGQVNGPVLPALPYTLRKLSDVLDEIVTIASPLWGPAQAVIWEIDYNKVFRVFGALDAGHTAPFNVAAGDTNVWGDIRIVPTQTDYANKVWLLYGTGTKQVVDTLGTGNGIQTVFTVHYPVSTHDGYINVGGTVTAGVISGGVNESLGAVGSGATWEYNPSASTVTRTSAPTGAIHFPMLAAFPASVSSGSPAPSAMVEQAHIEEEIFDSTVAQAVCDGLLAKTSLQFKEVTYTTPTPGCHPGMTQTITDAKHGISGTHLITKVRIHDRMETQLLYEITAIAGTSAVPESWIATYEGWGKSGAGAAGGSVIIVGTATVAVTNQWFLGGSRNTSIGPNPAAWTPVPEYVPFTAPATFGARVRADIWARNAGISVQARLWDVTAGSAVAASSVQTSQTPVAVTFNVSLTLNHKYRLEIIAGTNGEGVFGIGVLEGV